ncbi:MAG: hypothetical protein KGI37_01275 [Alphaproteobacteria bacterium]|nr:hypothetical protein [Alphaproteobacteria bacterium]
MLGLSLKTDEFFQTVIQSKIDAGDLAFPDPATDFILFYAGPSKEILRRLNATATAWGRIDETPNWKTAANEAKRLGAGRLDDTNLFSYLMSAAFEADLAAAIGSTDIKDTKKQIWDSVSDKLAHTNFREAATLVCGADEASSFVQKEMLGMLDGTHLEILNKRPANLFRDFKALGADEVQRLMSATYLLELKAYAKANKDVEAVKFYKRQRAFFLAWRVDKRTALKAQPQDARMAFRQTRKEILVRHNGSAKQAPNPPANSNVAPVPPSSNTL